VWKTAEKPISTSPLWDPSPPEQPAEPLHGDLRTTDDPRPDDVPDEAEDGNHRLPGADGGKGPQDGDADVRPRVVDVAREVEVGHSGVYD